MERRGGEVRGNGGHTFHRRETQLPCDLRIADFTSICERHAAYLKPHHKSASYQSIYPPHSPSQDISFKRRTHQFRQIRTTRNRAPAAKRLELHILDGVGVRVDFDLQFHDVAAGGRADEARADGSVGFGHGAHVARGGIVVEDFFVVGAARGVGGVEERGGEARGVWADGAGGEG